MREKHSAGACKVLKSGQRKKQEIGRWTQKLRFHSYAKPCHAVSKEAEILDREQDVWVCMWIEKIKSTQHVEALPIAFGLVFDQQLLMVDERKA